MSAINDLFCSECHNILDLPKTEDFISCHVCGKTYSATSFENKTMTYFSTPKRPNSLLTSFKNGDKHQGATIKEKCPRCNHPELEFYTLQLRSADEGQTVFYQCPKCSYKYSVNS